MGFMTILFLTSEPSIPPPFPLIPLNYSRVANQDNLVIWRTCSFLLQWMSLPSLIVWLVGWLFFFLDVLP